ncbi:reverse transcriptase domain-containing protein [Tanacetum coccineum]
MGESDPHRHIADFPKISNLFQYGENQEEAVMLRTFPFSLCEEANIWLNELNEGTITSWNEMREAFISRYFSPAKFKCLLNDIRNFHQLGEFQISPKTVVSAGGSNIDSYHAMLMEKFEDLVTKIDSEFLTIRKELKEMRDGQRQFEFLLPTESLPRTTNTKPRHEFVYKPPLIRNNDNKGDVKFIEVDETQTVPTMPNPNPIEANSPTISPFPKDCTVHIPYTDAKTFADVVLLKHVGEKEFKSIIGDGIGVLTNKKIKKNDMGFERTAMEWNMKGK